MATLAMPKPHGDRPIKGLGAKWYAASTAAALKDYTELAQRIASQLAEGSAVLEVAPGPGYLSIELAKLGSYAITGLDLSPDFVKIAARKAAEAGVKVDFKQGSASSLPFPKESFDFLVCRAAFKNFGDPVGALQEMCRVVSAVHLDNLRESPDWALWIGILATTAVGAVPSRRGRIDEALRRSYEDVTTQMEAIYTSLLEFIGYRVRRGLTVRQFAIAAAALTEGSVLRDRVDPVEMNGIVRNTGRSGEEQHWTLFGLALHGLADQFFELNVEWELERVVVLEASDAEGAVGPELI